MAPCAGRHCGLDDMTCRRTGPCTHVVHHSLRNDPVSSDSFSDARHSFQRRMHGPTIHAHTIWKLAASLDLDYDPSAALPAVLKATKRLMSRQCEFGNSRNISCACAPGRIGVGQGGGGDLRCGMCARYPARPPTAPAAPAARVPPPRACRASVRASGQKRLIAAKSAHPPQHNSQLLQRRSSTWRATSFPSCATRLPLLALPAARPSSVRSLCTSEPQLTPCRILHRTTGPKCTHTPLGAHGWRHCSAAAPRCPGPDAEDSRD